MVTQHDEWWLSYFGTLDEGPGPIDYSSWDGKTVVEVKRAWNGSRGLHAAILELAIYLDKQPQVERACLVLGRSRMSQRRIEEEWRLAKSVMKSTISNRLAIIVVEHGSSWVSPDEPHMREIAAHFERTWISGGNELVEALPQSPGQKSHEVIKLLLNRWLRKQGPIAIGDLAEEVGCSYPTVRKTLNDSTLRNSLTTTSSRSVELRSFPHDSWREIIALSTKLRNSFRFQDRSGEKPSPQSLLKRIERVKPANVALGGVVSARYWHPDFDLNGTPRIDLLYHTPNGHVDFDFVRKLDPALSQTDDPSESAILVIHPLVRAVPLFIEQSGKAIQLADPVETALDLNDLSLTVQANQLLTHLRPEVRLA